MSLKDLVEGECGGPNSLMQVTSHFVQDRGLRDEGIHPYRHQEESFVNSNPDQLLHQFFEQTLGSSQQSFRMDSLLAEMRDIEAASYRSMPQQSAPISLLATQDDAQEWAEQFKQSGSHFKNTPPEDIWNNASFNPDPNDPVLNESDIRFNLQSEDTLGFGPQWGNEYLAEKNNIEDNNTQEELFNLRALSEDYTDIRSARGELKASAAENVNIHEKHPEMTKSKLMKFMSGLANNESDLAEQASGESIKTTDELQAKEWEKEFEKENAQKWENDFLGQNDNVISDNVSAAPGSSSSLLDPSLDSNDMWSQLSNQWKEIEENKESSDSLHPWFSDFEQQYKDYQFSSDNPMVDNVNAYEEGLKKLTEGDIPSAILYFEAAAQQFPENAEVWCKLGVTLAENEQDPQAIRALRKCLSVMPNNLTALMSLAVCYTNETYNQEALSTLKDWIMKNEKYNTEAYKAMDFGPFEVPFHELHKEVLTMYINAAREHPTETMDPDIQCGLGVLFNLTEEYSKAVDCFKAALQVKPNDARLWNRLGATLANGNRSEEAVDAYHNALQLDPGFIRARYNLGITCVHLGANREAVEHFLTALNQQASAKGVLGESPSRENMSDSIWYSLRIAVASIDQTPSSFVSNVNQAISNRDLTVLNQEFGLNSQGPISSND